MGFETGSLLRVTDPRSDEGGFKLARLTKVPSTFLQLFSTIRSSGQFRQTRRRNCLSVAFVFLVRNVEGDAACEIRKFNLQNFLRARNNDVAAWPGGDAPENQHILEFVEICVMRHGI